MQSRTNNIMEDGTHVRKCLFGRNERGDEMKVLVDTGATFTVIPKVLAERLGVPKLRKERVKLATNGMEVKAEEGVVHVKIKEREAPTTVLIMDCEEPLLGVEALETLGLKVNPETEELEPTRSFVLRV
jgi:aspartyl protease family protein